MPEGSRLVKPDGEAVRRLRKLNGWSVEDLAGMAKITPATVMSIEKGKGCFPRNLALVAKALGVKVAEIVLDERRGADVKQAESQTAVVHRFVVKIRTGDPYRAVDETQDPALILRMLCSRLPGAEVEYLGAEPGSTVYSFLVEDGDPAVPLYLFRNKLMGRLGPEAVMVAAPGGGPLSGFPDGWVGSISPEHLAVMRNEREQAVREPDPYPPMPAQIEADSLLRDVVQRELWALGPFARCLTMTEHVESLRRHFPRTAAGYGQYALAAVLLDHVRAWLGTAPIPHTLAAAEDVADLVRDFCSRKSCALAHPETGEACRLVATAGPDGGELFLEDERGGLSHGTSCVSTLMPFKLRPLDPVADGGAELVGDVVSSPV